MRYSRAALKKEFVRAIPRAANPKRDNRTLSTKNNAGPLYSRLQPILFG
jgi:hypothetical protein